MTLPRFEASPGVPIEGERRFTTDKKHMSYVWPPCRFCGAVVVTDGEQTCRECWRVAILAPAAMKEAEQ